MIAPLVSDLPEIYQPIFGHPELSEPASRASVDRLEPIVRAYDALQKLLGRPLKVLDLGCAQGYFSLSLAERGAIVHGVDFLDRNVAVCNALAAEHPALVVSFQTGRVEDIIGTLESEQYDLVLGLSIFHHIVHEQGASVVKILLEQLAEHAGALIVEMALREEPLYWASAQPEDPRDLLDGVAFVHEIDRSETHLGSILRPIFFASNKCWFLDGQAVAFQSWTFDPHALAHSTHEFSRRYYYGSDVILKVYRFDHSRGDHNKSEYAKEIRFLKDPPTEFPSPALITYGENEQQGWLVMERLPGTLLLDRLLGGEAIEVRSVLLSLLRQLSVLEKSGLYHDDVRLWNALVADDCSTTYLIDYGSISPKAQDCVWPENVFLSFFIIVREITEGIIDDGVFRRAIAISPYNLPLPYRVWAKKLWARPLVEWSFTTMYETLLDTPVDVADDLLEQPEDVWMKAMEDAVQWQNQFMGHLRDELAASRDQSHQMVSVLKESHDRKLDQLNSTIESLRAQHKAAESAALSVESRSQELEGRLQEAEARARHAEEQFAAVCQSRSWRITAPLRLASVVLRGFRPMGPRQVAKWVIRMLARQVRKRPSLRWAVSRILEQSPGLKRRLLMLEATEGATSRSGAAEVAALSARERQIYQCLKDVAARRRKTEG